MGRIMEVPQFREEEVAEEEAGSEEESDSQGEGSEAVAEGGHYQVIQMLQRLHASQEEYHMEMREYHKEMREYHKEMKELRQESKVWMEKLGRDLEKILELLQRLPAPVNPTSVSLPTPSDAQVQPSSPAP